MERKRHPLAVALLRDALELAVRDHYDDGKGGDCKGCKHARALRLELDSLTARALR